MHLPFVCGEVRMLFDKQASPLVDCARANCTGGEVTAALQGVFGTWREVAAF